MLTRVDGVGDEHEIAERPERAFGDSVEAGDLDVGRRPAHASLQALVHLRDRKGLALHLAGKVAAAGNHHFFTFHGRPR